MSAILAPELGAPILWAPGIFAFFLQEILHVHKIPCFRGGVFWFFFFGGGSADFIFMGAGIFLTYAMVLWLLLRVANGPMGMSFGNGIRNRAHRVRFARRPRAVAVLTHHRHMRTPTPQLHASNS